MNPRLQFLQELGQLTQAERQSEALANISRWLEVKTFILFVPDPETGELLTAPGFPQTLPSGLRWRAFLKRCARDEHAQEELPWGTPAITNPVYGYACCNGGAVVFVGGPPQAKLLEDMLAVLPSIAAAFKGELLRELQHSQTKFSEELARQSTVLARSLDEARSGLQKQLIERQRAESELRLAREELQRRADDLELRVAERTARLRDTVAELEAFSYSVAHDMRAPLRAMQGYASFVSETQGEKLDEQAHKALLRISASSIRLDHLIRDVLTYSRIVRGEFNLNSVDMHQSVREIIDHYPEWHPPHAEVVVEGKLPVVTGNEAFLTQCVSNIVGNAIKFVSPGQTPRVVISARHQGESVQLRFQDNGIGIEPKNHERIFQMFERLHHLNEYEGTGIGLAIVRKAAERMEGRVGVESQPGRGSVFWIELKAAHETTGASD